MLESVELLVGFGVGRETDQASAGLDTIPGWAYMTGWAYMNGRQDVNGTGTRRRHGDGDKG